LKKADQTVSRDKSRSQFPIWKGRQPDYECNLLPDSPERQGGRFEGKSDTKGVTMIVNHNLSAVNAHKAVKFRNWDVQKSMAKLASGERINNAGDDATGLAVSEKMRTQVQGLRQAERNTEDGISFVQTAEGFIAGASDIMQRIRVLAIQSANGIYTDKDRQMMQAEVSQLVDELDRTASQAEFNTMNILQGQFSRINGKLSMWFHMGPNAKQRERVYVQTMTAQALGMRDPSKAILSLSTPSKADEVLGRVDVALQRINKQRADLGAYANRLERSAKGLMVAY
jgi:flagellin